MPIKNEIMSDQEKALLLANACKTELNKAKRDNLQTGEPELEGIISQVLEGVQVVIQKEIDKRCTSIMSEIGAVFPTSLASAVKHEEFRNSFFTDRMPILFSMADEILSDEDFVPSEDIDLVTAISTIFEGEYKKFFKHETD